MEASATPATNDGGDEDQHPWPYLRGMFSYVGVKDSSYRMKCLLCLPKATEILAFKNSPSNLRKHIERKHVHHLTKYGADINKEKKGS
ncbi:hypothetical protein VZT92_026523 [Zoarces viviparus]|uniref:BED-type domain-containing protein n=1 Tax=Zoarces viviparus TaxID=48416 RepID=A0AAW1E2A3_ZOAVI